MTTVVNFIIKKMREDSKFLDEMRLVYPGDPTNSIGADIYLLDKAAGWLERINWQTERDLYLETLPKTEVTYINDND